MKKLLKKINNIFLKRAASPANKFFVVADVGCRWGYDKTVFRRDSGAEFRIFGFEPDAAECQVLNQEALSKGCQFNAYPVALGKRESFVDFYHTKEPACSSIYEPIEKLSRNLPLLSCTSLERVSRVRTRTLKNWAKENDIQRIDYLKIDTQGSELDIIKGAGKILSSVMFLDVEVEFNEIYRGQPLFCSLDLFLRRKGFELWGLGNIVHYSTLDKNCHQLRKMSICFDHTRQDVPVGCGQLYWADASYINTRLLSSFESQDEWQRAEAFFEGIGRAEIPAHFRKLFFG